jgi:hypothetical protein
LEKPPQPGRRRELQLCQKTAQFGARASFILPARAKLIQTNAARFARV